MSVIIGVTVKKIGYLGNSGRVDYSANHLQQKDYIRTKREYKLINYMFRSELTGYP